MTDSYISSSFFARTGVVPDVEVDLAALADQATTDLTTAVAQASAAAASATAAASSATSAQAAQTAAGASQTAAATSATNASSSASTASTAATNASNSATSAAGSATSAAASATAAAAAAAAGATGAQNTIVGRTASGTGLVSVLSAPMIGLITAADSNAARTVLGNSTLGNTLDTAANAGVARTALGSTTVGDAVFIAASAAAARTATGAAASGANSDITSLSGLSTALSVAQGGTGATTAAAAAHNLGLGTADSPTFAGLSLTAALAVAQGGTGSTTAANARTALGAAASGTNADITSMTGLNNAGVPSTKVANNVRAWAQFTISAGVVTINGSFNVSSVTRNSAGNFTVNFTSAIGNTNYAVIVTPQSNGTFFLGYSDSTASGSFKCYVASTAGTNGDPTPGMSVLVIGA